MPVKVEKLTKQERALLYLMGESAKVTNLSGIELSKILGYKHHSSAGKMLVSLEKKGRIKREKMNPVDRFIFEDGYFTSGNLSTSQYKKDFDEVVKRNHNKKK